jgi:hypothetical protein
VGASADLASAVAVGRRRTRRGKLVLTLLIVAVVVATVVVLSRGEETGTSVRSGDASPQRTSPSPAHHDTGGSAPGNGPSLYSRRDRALMAAVAAGLVPEEALRSERFLILRLVNPGLIPRQTLDA